MTSTIPVLSEDKSLVYFRNPVAVAKYKLTVIQQKVFIELALMAKKSPDTDVYQLYLRDFIKKIGTSTNDLAAIKMQIAEMAHIPIVIDKTKRGGVADASIFASVERFPDDPREYVEIEISKKIKPYFIEFAEGEYFKYEIRNTRKLKSIYSIRLYLFLKSWRRAGKVTVGYEELRTIAGVEAEEYKLFGDFHKRVIKAAYEELQDKTDLRFEYILERERRNHPNSPVTKIIFKIADNGAQLEPQAVIPLMVDPDTELTALARGVEEADLSMMLSTYGRERVLDVLVLYQEETAKGTQIRNPTGYLLTALKNQSAQGKAKGRETKKSGGKHLLEDKMIKAFWNKDCEAFKARYIYQLGVDATNEEKHSYLTQLIDEIAKNPALKKRFYINEELNQDAARSGLGYEIYKDTVTDDQLFVLFMQSIGKPVERVAGYWRFSN